MIEGGLREFAKERDDYASYRLTLAQRYSSWPEMAEKINEHYERKLRKANGLCELDVPEFVTLSLKTIQVWFLIWFSVTISLPILEFWKKILTSPYHFTRKMVKLFCSIFLKIG